MDDVVRLSVVFGRNELIGAMSSLLFFFLLSLFINPPADLCFFDVRSGVMLDWCVLCAYGVLAD